ncbi:unnamed protein product [Acanthoscelides obtectus]|uniref:Uncharacterized protein n=1 Tax=Acanthoscelides obtectus TaxID=200917 RepID=A0A9P0KBC6_ACAOB|nr:unnamed protein product [Acanthoscelides obtectus]CAK1645377.1 hypothetical protein AOBTE_LOCUS14098 [Acanthoscelides obtectus]
MNERGDRDSEQDTWSKIVETVRNTPKSILKSIRATIRASGGAKDADRLKTAGFGDKEQAASKVFGTDREITLPERNRSTRSVANQADVLRISQFRHHSITLLITKSRAIGL